MGWRGLPDSSDDTPSNIIIMCFEINSVADENSVKVILLIFAEVKLHCKHVDKYIIIL